MRRYRIRQHADGDFTVQHRKSVWHGWETHKEFPKDSISRYHMWPATRFFESLAEAEEWVAADKERSKFPITVKEL